MTFYISETITEYVKPEIIPKLNIILYVYLKYLFFIWILRNPSLEISLRANISSIGNKTEEWELYIYMYLNICSITV